MDPRVKGKRVGATENLPHRSQAGRVQSSGGIDGDEGDRPAGDLRTRRNSHKIKIKLRQVSEVISVKMIVILQWNRIILG